jgi:C4-dicarboxylate transporter, DctQ subunit
MSITEGYIKINRQFEKLEKLFAVTIISAIVVIVFVGTVARYFFNSPLFGADRLATYLMVWLGFIGFQIATSKLRHIEVEFVKARVSQSVKCKMNMALGVIGSLFLFVFSYFGFMYVNQSMELNDLDLVLSLPLWSVIIIIPITFLISGIRMFFITFLWLDVLQGKRKEEDFVQKQLI